MAVGEHCKREPLTIRRGDSVRDVAKAMELRQEGCGVAVDEAGRPVGILTDRDIAVRVLRRNLDPDETLADDVMSEDIMTIHETTPLVTAMRRMRAEGVRRLPVVDASSQLVGVFDWNDAIRIVASELHQAARVATAQDRTSGEK